MWFWWYSIYAITIKVDVTACWKTTKYICCQLSIKPECVPLILIIDTRLYLQLQRNLYLLTVVHFYKSYSSFLNNNKLLLMMDFNPNGVRMETYIIYTMRTYVLVIIDLCEIGHNSILTIEVK